MIEALLAFPFPVFGAPVAGIFVTAGLDEFHVLAVGYWKCADRKFGNGNLLSFEFVVPTEGSIASRFSEGRGARWNRDPARSWRGPRIAPRRGMRNFALEWQIVKQIRESLSVHQAMFDRDM